jgi:predicted permease
MPYPATQFIRQHNEVLSAVLTQTGSEIVWEEDAARKVPVHFVSANWFAELGYAASLGRFFDEQLDEKADAPPTVILAHQFWRTRFASDARIVGRTVRLNERVATVVGVAPPDFPDLDFQNPQMWLLIHQIDYFEPGTTFKTAWGNSAAFYARVRPGLSPQAAADGLRPTIAALAQLRPKEFKADEWVEVATAEQRFVPARDRVDILAVASLIGGLTLLVLVVASANLGNLVLSHAIGRLREFSVRSALGASRWRILRHILVECALLATAGAAGGIALGQVSARVFASITEMPPYLDFTPGGSLLLAAVAAAFVAMLAFGLIPAWMVSRRDLIRAMKDGGHQTSASLARARFRLVLVGAQVLGCCALLVVAGAMARGLQRLLVADPGFSFDRVALADVSLGRYGVSSDAARAYWSDVTPIVASHPDVERMSLVYPAPLGGAVNQSGYGSDSGPLAITVMRVDPAFFELLNIPLLAGRNFTATDDRSVVIISRRVALKMYGTLDVLGKRYPRTDQGRNARTIIGIAGDASVMQPRASNSAEEYMILDAAHLPEAALLVRSRTDPQRLLTPLRQAAKSGDRRVSADTRLLASEYEAKLRGPRLASTIAGLVAGLVLTLACLGIFGVVAYAVKLRTKEIGIRRALGAGAPDVYGTLLRQLAWPVGIGTLLGTATGFGASLVLGHAPFHLAVADATAPVVAFIVFAVAGLAAALVPASRALSADPLRALRHE